MFYFLISLISLIICMLLVTVLYNVANRFVYITSGYTLDDTVIPRCIFVGMILLFLCFLLYDTTTSINMFF